MPRCAGVSLDEQRPPRARDRADVLCRDRARAARRRQRAPRLLEAVRPDRVSSRSSDALLATRRRALAGRARSLGRASRRGRRRGASATSQYETDRARFIGRGRSIGAAGRHDSTAGRFEHGRHGARPGLRAAPPRARSRPAATARVAFWTWSRRRAPSSCDLVDKHQRPQRVRAGGDAGLDPGAGAAPPSRRRAPTRRATSSAWPADLLYADPALRPPSETILRGSRRPSRRSGPHGISGDLPIVLRAHRRGRGHRHRSASCCARTSTGA